MKTSAKTDHLAPLDGLRGIAILLVMWFHVWQQSWLGANVTVFGTTFNFDVFPIAGFTGVDLFYFISGFVLFYPYACTLFDGKPLQSVATFAYRRALKILPSYYLACILSIALGFRHFDSQGDAVKQIVTHVFFVHNFFDDTYGGIDSVAWSLAVEVQFYVLFPLICWCAMRRPLPTFGAMFVLGIAYRFAILHQSDAVHMIDWLPGAIDLFGSGMLAAWLFRKISAERSSLATNRRLWTVVAAAGFLAFYLALRQVYDHRYDPNWTTWWKFVVREEMLPAMVAMALGSLFAFAWWQRLLANRVLVFLSFISYNLYLWHQEIAMSLRLNDVFAHVTPDVHNDQRWQLADTIGSFVAAILVAWAITVWFEQPLLRRRPFEYLLTGAHPKPRELANPALP